MSSQTETASSLGLVRRYPIDLAVCTGLAIVCWYVVTTMPAGSRLRIAFALPLLAFLPGFVLGAVLFPGSPERIRTQQGQIGRRQGITIAERLALSIGLSLAVLPMVVVAIGVSPFALDPPVGAAAIAMLTIVSAQFGAWRRLQLPEGDRFVARPLYWIGQLTGESDDVQTTVSVVLLIATMAMAAGVLAFALATPSAGASYSEIALYGEDENGTQAIGAVPTAIEPDGEIPIAVEITNENRERRNYTVVVQQQNVTTGNVTERTEVTRLDYDLAVGASEKRETTIRPAVGLEQTVRVVALMYETDDRAVPSNPTIDNADDYVYFHTHVTEDPDDDGDIVVG